MQHLLPDGQAPLSVQAVLHKTCDEQTPYSPDRLLQLRPRLLKVGRFSEPEEERPITAPPRPAKPMPAENNHITADGTILVTIPTTSGSLLLKSAGPST